MGARRGEWCDKFQDRDGLDGEETAVRRKGEKELGTGLVSTVGSSWRKGEGMCLEKEDGRGEVLVGGRDGEIFFWKHNVSLPIKSFFCH